MALLPSPVPRSRTKAKLAWLALARVLDGASPWAGRIGHLAISGKGAREGAPGRYRARVEYDGTDLAGFHLEHGRSRENAKPRWQRSPVETGSESKRRVEPMPGFMPPGR